MFGRKKKVKIDGKSLIPVGLAIIERRLASIVYLLEDIRQNTCEHAELEAIPLKDDDYIISCLKCATAWVMTKGEVRKRFPNAQVAWEKRQKPPKTTTKKGKGK
jgi:hypothetical protein